MKPYYKEETITIPANGQITVDRQANYLYIISSSIGNSLLVAIDENADSTMREGLAYKSEEPFFKLVFKNPTGGVAVIEVAMANGDVVNQNTQLSGSINADQTATVISTPAVINVTSSGQTLAGVADQKEVILFNNGPDVAWFGVDTATVNPAGKVGTPLAVNDTIILSTSAAIGFKTDAGQTATVSVNRLRKP